MFNPFRKLELPSETPVWQFADNFPKHIAGSIGEDKPEKPNIIGLTRSIFKGVQECKHIEDLTEDEKKDLYTQANLMFHNKGLKFLVDSLIQEQTELIAKEAETLEQVNFGRATMNGVSLLYEEISRLNTIYMEQIQNRDKFDKHAVLNDIE